MRWSVWVVAIVGACGFRSEVPGVRDGPDRDAAIDAPDAPVDASLDAAVACTTSGLTCSGVKQFYNCNGDCWVTCPDSTSHAQAAARCVTWGGRLAPMTTLADQACVMGFVFNPDASWIGLEQMVGEQTLAGAWSWNNDGIALGYVNWAPGQPSDADGIEDGQEQCAYLSTSNSWQDTSCAVNLLNFSCRRN